MVKRFPNIAQVDFPDGYSENGKWVNEPRDPVSITGRLQWGKSKLNFGSDADKVNYVATFHTQEKPIEGAAFLTVGSRRFQIENWLPYQTKNFILLI